MRPVCAVLPLLALLVPVPASAADARDAAAVLNDPATQERMADTITALVGAMMQMPVGPLAEAVARIDPSSDAALIPPDATVGDLTDHDPGYAERMGGDVRTSARMAGHAASAVAAYAPVIKDMARDLLAQWEAERAAARR
ncbi:hypothetical protein [Sphingopyxis sp.]|uniref:hypothetical protein n=1 Tax=Sphingopyxis sp. TaxID=1908224 RepID=UPI00258FE4D9|nr:hypothetical protein [Sphingopyxis sp.]